MTSSLGIPFSDLASAEARRAHAIPEPPIPATDDIAEQRRLIDALWMIPGLAKMRETFHVDIEERLIGGVMTDVVTPRGGVPERNRNRVLINAHGGGFLVAARYSGQQEATSIAAVGGFRVVTVDYRMAPEHVHPAALEDMEAVYRALLEDYPAENIGLYGCSAGGILSGQAVAWFRDRGLPRPGGVGMFGAGAVVDVFGDSSYLGGIATGAESIPVLAPGVLLGEGHHHFGADPRGPLVSPAYHEDVLREFPPSLLVSGSRDFSLSAVLFTHAQLVAAGVDARLHVWEGQEHCAFAQSIGVDPDVPEQRQAWDVIARFFDRVLGS